jgi:hypothetical protein
VRGDALVGGCYSEKSCGVSHSHCPAGYDLIILLNRIVNVDVQVRECVTETTPTLLKLLPTVNISPMLPWP